MWCYFVPMIFFLHITLYSDSNVWLLMLCFAPQTVGISRMFHPECFVCDSCGEPVGEKDPYTLLHSGKLLW